MPIVRVGGKNGGEAVKKIEKLKRRESQEWFDKINELVDAHNEMWSWRQDHVAPKQTQEPECEHEWIESSFDFHLLCKKCGVRKEKPAKKERCNPQYLSTSVVVKDELAERLDNKLCHRGTIDIEVLSKELANEARKWAVEVVQKSCPRVDPMGFCVRIDELVARLNEPK